MGEIMTSQLHLLVVTGEQGFLATILEPWTNIEFKVELLVELYSRTKWG